MRKNIIVDFHMWCNEAVMQKYILISVSNVSRINIKSWTTYWDLWSKWYIWHMIQVLHTIAHDNSVPETWKNATYDTDTIYYSMIYHSHVQIHMYFDT